MDIINQLDIGTVVCIKTVSGEELICKIEKQDKHLIISSYIGMIDKQGEFYKIRLWCGACTNMAIYKSNIIAIGLCTLEITKNYKEFLDLLFEEEVVMIENNSSDNFKEMEVDIEQLVDLAKSKQMNANSNIIQFSKP